MGQTDGDELPVLGGELGTGAEGGVHRAAGASQHGHLRHTAAARVVHLAREALRPRHALAHQRRPGRCFGHKGGTEAGKGETLWGKMKATPPKVEPTNICAFPRGVGTYWFSCPGPPWGFSPKMVPASVWSLPQNAPSLGRRQAVWSDSGDIQWKSNVRK